MTEKSDMEQIKAKIWLTSKTKMEAEKRFNKYDSFTHIQLCVFSIVLIGITVFGNKLPQSVPLEAYTIIFSVSIIVFSVVVFGFSFGKTATLHRECYLRLQKLRDSRSDAEEIERSYHEIISSYPNHNDTDYERLILNRTLFHSAKLTSPSGENIIWSWPMLLKHIAYFLVFWLVPIVVFLSSIGSMFWLW